MSTFYVFVYSGSESAVWPYRTTHSSHHSCMSETNFYNWLGLSCCYTMYWCENQVYTRMLYYFCYIVNCDNDVRRCEKRMLILLQPAPSKISTGIIRAASLFICVQCNIYELVRKVSVDTSCLSMSLFPSHHKFVCMRSGI